MLPGHFSKKQPSWKFLYYRIGTSGRVLLNIVANNTNPIIFGAIMTELAPRIIESHLRKGKRVAENGRNGQSLAGHPICDKMLLDQDEMV